MSVIASTLTTIAVFLPLTMISGMAVCYSTFAGLDGVDHAYRLSTIAAITFTPVLCSLMKQNPTKAWFQGKIDAVMARFNNFYGGILNWCVYTTARRSSRVPSPCSSVRLWDWVPN